MRDTGQFARDYNEVASHDGRDSTWTSDISVPKRTISPRIITAPEADLTKLYRSWHPSDRDDSWTEDLQAPSQQIGETSLERIMRLVRTTHPEDWVVKQQTMPEDSIRIGFSVSARSSSHLIEPEFTVAFDRQTQRPELVELSVLNLERLEAYIAPLIDAKRKASASLGDCISHEREHEIRDANKPAFYEVHQGDDVTRLFSVVWKKLPNKPTLNLLQGEHT